MIDPLSLSSHQALALTLWGEARGEAVEGRIAVGCVVRARVRDPRWPTTYQGVCLQPRQFSCWNEADPNAAKLHALAAVFLADHAIRTAPRLDPVLRECLYLAEGIIGGQLLENVAGANHYLIATLFQTAPPAWAQGQGPVARVGRHVFLKL